MAAPTPRLSTQKVLDDLKDVFAEAIGWTDLGYEITPDGNLKVESYDADGNVAATRLYQITPRLMTED